MWDSFEARGGIMCKACERRGRACTPTDLITARGLLRISRLFWQLEINRAVNEHPQRGGHVSPGPAWSGLARTGPARSHAVLGESRSNGFSRHVRVREVFWSAAEQRGQITQSLPVSWSPRLTWLISVNEWDHRPWEEGCWGVCVCTNSWSDCRAPWLAGRLRVLAKPEKQPSRCETRKGIWLFKRSNISHTPLKAATNSSHANKQKDKKLYSSSFFFYSVPVFF